MTDTLQKKIFAELYIFMQPLVDTGGDLRKLIALFRSIGWNLENLLGGADLQGLAASFQQIANSARDLQSVVNTPPADLSAFSLKLAESAAPIFRDIEALASKLPAELPEAAKDIPIDLLQALTIRYMVDKSGALFYSLELLGIINKFPEHEELHKGKVYRIKNALPIVQFSQIEKLLRDPIQAFSDKYWTEGENDNDQGTVDAAIGLLNLLGALGLLSRKSGSIPGDLDEEELAIWIDDNKVTLLKNILLDDYSSAQIGVELAFLDANHGGPGVVLTPRGKWKINQNIGKYVVNLVGSIGSDSLKLTSAGIVPLDPNKSSIDGKLTLEKDRDLNGPLFIVGSESATYLSLQDAVFSIKSLVTLIDYEIGLELDLRSLRLRIAAEASGGFLQKILPKDGVHVDFDLTVGWSNKRGLYFKGGAGLEATLPVNIDFLGVIKIDSVYLALEAKEDSKTKESAIQAVTATTVKVQLGPVSAIVERFGLQATLSFPEKGGNLGVANLDLGFKPPNGVGLTIKAQVVTGGGYLYFDFEKEQYAGVLQLEIAQKFSLTAVGLLTTKMPDGSKGFSLLVIISVRFDPGIQLGYGFSLNGLGGLLGVNRTVRAEVLRDGLRRGALGSILFPQNVVENAPQIISNLSAIFPPAQDRFLFGPMAIIGWGGSPPILTLELGIILELPEPVRLMILGRLRVVLPNKKEEADDSDGEKKEQAPKLKLQLDALGIFDFGSGDISLDAVLYDSTIGPFAVTGQMALRASFGTQPMFLLSVGGFHPAFQAPAGFPSVERVAIGLHKNEKGVEVRLQLSAYFALTSNTIQFGSHLDLYVHIAGFVEIIGLLRFDALIQFQPFGLMVSFEAMVSVKAFGQTLMAVGLQVNLTGPSPWHVWGKAHFTILFFSGTAEFDALIGQQDTLPPPPPIDVETELFKELQKLSNWSSQLPVGENPLVTFCDSIPSKDQAATSPKKRVLVHPLAELHVNQRLVPLDADPITKYGTTTPTGATTFALEVTKKGKTPSTSTLTVSDLSDWFALAQFYVMSDAEKLAAPSFEEKHSGVRVKATAGYTCGEPVVSDIAAARLSKNGPTSDLAAKTFLDQVAHLGAAGQSPMRAAGPAKYGDPTWWDQGITLVKAGYRVVGEEDDSPAPKAHATRRAGAPSPASAFEEVMDGLAAIAEPVMSYSAAQARATRARQRSPKRRTWVVPDIGVPRGGR